MNAGGRPPNFFLLFFWLITDLCKSEAGVGLPEDLPVFVIRTHCSVFRAGKPMNGIRDSVTKILLPPTPDQVLLNASPAFPPPLARTDALCWVGVNDEGVASSSFSFSIPSGSLKCFPASRMLLHDSSRTIQTISAVDMNETRVTARADSDFPSAITFGLFVTTQICS